MIIRRRRRKTVLKELCSQNVFHRKIKKIVNYKFLNSSNSHDETSGKKNQTNKQTD